MYVPLLKNREEEMRVLNDLNYCFDDDIIPLVEVIDDFYELKYEIDESTGKPYTVLKTGGKRATKIKMKPTKDDVITIKVLLEILNGKNVFVDYFRYSFSDYGSRVNVESVKLSRELSLDYDEYKKHLVALSDYSNLIPVISIKKNFEIETNEFKSLIMELQKSNLSIGVRIREESIDKYANIICDLLRSSDYIIFDICNNTIGSKFIEIKSLMQNDAKSKRIIVNCQRDSKMKNGEFIDCNICSSIDTSLIKKYRDYGFDGFGDYCGYKDVLPTSSKTKGEGAALAILYNFSDNAFYSFVNYNTKDGVSGYYQVVQKIFNFCPSVMNNYDKCPAFNKIRNFGIGKTKYGVWKTWNNITISRYIHQIYINKSAI